MFTHNAPKMVSIVIPVYNVSAYIERCIRSVIAQSYNNIECIIVDDCTPDDSIDKCEMMIAEYNGPIEFKITHHDRNRGLSAARNTGTNAATGEWIFYLDSDDEITPNTIELLFNETKACPELEMVVGNVCSIPYIDNYYELKFPYYPYRLISNNIQARTLFYSPSPIMPVMAWNKLIRKDFLIRNSLFFKEGIIHEDELWMFFLIKHLNSVSFIEQYTYLHYHTPGSIMQTTKQEVTDNVLYSILQEQLIHIDNPCKDLQIFHSMSMYLRIYHSINPKKRLSKVKRKLLINILKLLQFKLAFYFFISHHSNHYFQITKYSLLPNIFNKALSKHVII